MEAVILAGGLGTRLQAALPHLPKALAPIQNAPFLKILLDQLQRWNQISRVILAVGHKASVIQSYVQNLQYPFPIYCSMESTPLGTGGALLNALPLVTKETFLVMNGDSFFDLPLEPFLEFHQNHKALASIACLEIEDTSRYGSIILDSSSRIQSFLEKSPSQGRGNINAGIYLIKKSALQSFPLTTCSLEKELFPSLLSQGMHGYLHAGTFIDIGTPSSLLDAQNILKKFA